MRRWAAILLLAAPIHAEMSVDDLLARLGRGTSDERRATVEALAALGPRHLPRLRPLLRDDQPAFRQIAALDVLIEWRAAALPALDRLVEMLDSREGVVARAVLEAIAAIGMPAHPARERLEEYVRRGPEADYATLALLSIRRQHEEYVRGLVAQPEKGPRLAALLVSAREGGAEVARALFRSPAAPVRQFAVRRLRYAPPAPAFWLALLKERVNRDDDMTVRTEAMAVLAETADASLRRFAEARTRDVLPRVRESAAALLAQLPPRESSQAALRALLRDKDGRVFGMAALALVFCGGKDGTLLPLLERTPTERGALGRIGGALLHVRCGGREAWGLDLAARGIIVLAPPTRSRFGLESDHLDHALPLPFDASSAREVLEPVGAEIAPYLRQAGDVRPFAALEELRRHGAAAREEIDSFRKHRNYYVRAEAVVTLIEMGDRSGAVAEDLVGLLRASGLLERIDLDAFVAATARWGHDELPTLLRAYAKLDWEREGSDEAAHDAFLRGLAGMGRRTPEVLRRLGYEELADRVEASP